MLFTTRGGMKQNTESDWARPLIILVNQISLVNITFYGAACTIVKGTKEEGRGLHKMTMLNQAPQTASSLALSSAVPSLWLCCS